MNPTSIVIDIASAPIEGAADYMEQVKAPSTYKDPEKIAAYIAEKTQERIGSLALDLDLARLTAVGILEPGQEPTVYLCRDENDERAAIVWVKSFAPDYSHTRPFVTYNGQSFDLPLVQRRARYLGVQFPKLNLDRYRSPHTDLMQELSDRDPSRRRPLSFYVRRHGWADLQKPLEGAEEARVHKSGRWDDLRASVLHDLVAAYRLACWMGVMDDVKVPAAEVA